jgi:hypothetical protein
VGLYFDFTAVSLYFLDNGVFFLKISYSSSESPPNNLLIFFFFGYSAFLGYSIAFPVIPRGFDFLSYVFFCGDFSYFFY